MTAQFWLDVALVVLTLVGIFNSLRTDLLRKRVEELERWRAAHNERLDRVDQALQSVDRALHFLDVPDSIGYRPQGGRR